MTIQLDPLHYAPLSFDCEVKELYTLENGLLGVVLDRTAFFPQGGGQTGDRGTLGGCIVENVEIRPEGILHLVKNCKETVQKLAPGTHLHAEIDPIKRFSDVQQHSGEHILSGIVHRTFGFNNVGFHLSQQEVTVDFDGILTENDICKVEDLVNEAIWKNLPIRPFFPAQAEAAALCYRSKKEVEGPLRLVEIEGVDLCACCAPHAAHTGEIGALRVIKSEKNRGGTRLWILCGRRLLLDTRQKLEQNRIVSTLLSAKQTETAAFAKKLKADHAALQYELVGLRRQLLQSRADAAPVQPVQFAAEDLDPETLRFFADRLAARATAYAFCCTAGDEKKFILLTKTGFDLQPVMQRLRERCSARGGGRGGVMQGSLTASEAELRAALAL